MRLKKQAIYLLYFLFCLSFTCFADESTVESSSSPKDQKMFANDKPIAIDADNQQIDIEKNIITFNGNVQIVQDGLTIWADKVVITDMQDSTKQKITGYGNPVKYKQIIPKNNKVVTGHSSQVIYDVKESNVVLQGDAELIQQDNRIKSSLITYDVKNQRIIAQPGKNERVKTTIIPIQVKEMNK